MQSLDSAAVVHRDVQQGADGIAVLVQAAGQAGGRGVQAAQQLLQLGGPLLHQAVDVRHAAAVVHAGGRFGSMQRADALHPAVHGARVRERTQHTGYLLQLQGEKESYTDLFDWTLIQRAQRGV